MEVKPIAYIRSPYKQKFAIPRQPNLVKEAVGEIVFEQEFADPNCLREIDAFSHLWLLFVFHETADKGWSPLVQPPRLGGKEKVGVFASRSTFRPNALGMSVVKNLGWTQSGSSLVLKVGGVDLLDGTPIVDIKPYIPYADIVPDAAAGYAQEVPGGKYRVEFSPEADEAVGVFERDYPGLRELMVAVLDQDPRPAWRHREPDEKRYGMSLYDLNIKWRVDDDGIRVLSVSREEYKKVEN